uniref:Uncharacterized protein n=1 Tax=Tupiella akineta TaxID=160070 RepID=Q6UVV7_TUPAK|nr:hypothetical protein PsakpMp09 [Tupiella akineta]AAQ18718.1 hypothetical protein [Tupiella akineta]
MIYTISQHKINTQCLNEYSKSLSEVKSNRPKNNLSSKIKKGLNGLPTCLKGPRRSFAAIKHCKLPTPLPQPLLFCQEKFANVNEQINPYKNDLYSEKAAVASLPQSRSNELTFSSCNQTAIQLLTSPFVLQSYSKVRGKILRKILLSHFTIGNKAIKQGNAVMEEQLQTANLFSGALLFSREDLAFINLRSLLSSLLKALHVCSFATLNNKRIIFVGDPQPLAQEHHQRLLSCFIGSQVKAFTTRITELLPPLPDSLGKSSCLNPKHSFQIGSKAANPKVATPSLQISRLRKQVGQHLAVNDRTGDGIGGKGKVISPFVDFSSLHSQTKLSEQAKAAASKWTKKAPNLPLPLLPKGLANENGQVLLLEEQRPKTIGYKPNQGFKKRELHNKHYLSVNRLTDDLQLCCKLRLRQKVEKAALKNNFNIPIKTRKQFA